MWGLDRSGYTFLPWISGKSKNKEERRRNYHEGEPFKWPEDRPRMLEHLTEHTQDDVYFPPNLFEGKQRIEQNVAAEMVLYADLDPVDPRGLGQLRPTHAWESSPGRYQAIWMMDRAKTGASWAGNENHRLTAALGADPSGWDATQLLRVPGRPNFKFDYKSKGKESVMGEGLMWMDGPRYSWSQFDDLPAVGSIVSGDIELMDEALIDAIDRHEVWGRVRLKVSGLVREYLAVRDERVTEQADRDLVLWQIERDLADAGCTLTEIVAIVRQSVWNKYRGRNDELKRLITEAAKALSERPDTLEMSETPKPGMNWLSEIVKKSIPRPKWLIRDIWTRGGCGFIAGAPKSFKSWMAIDMAVAVATGGLWLNQANFKVMRPGNVLYIQEEDDMRMVMQRISSIAESKAPDMYWHGQIEEHGGHIYWTPPTADIPIAMQVQTGFIASDAGWQAWLDEMIEEGQFELVIIDTLGTVAGELDTDKAGELMNQMLKPLKVLANKHDTAICVVHHNKKGEGSNRAGQDMLGSTALHAWVDCAIYARSKNAEGVVQIEREAKMAMDLSAKIKIPFMYEDYGTGERKLWDPEIITEVSDIVPSEERKAQPKAAGDKIVFQLKQMGRGPFTLEDIIDRTGHSSPAQLKRQLQSGVDNELIVYNETTQQWYVPKEK